MLEEWHDFYLLIGGASGALIGLLFVVASLTGYLDEQQTERGREIFISPTVYHFAVVLGVGGLSMAPHVPIRIGALIVAAAGLTGLGYMVVVLRDFVLKRTPLPPHWTDPWFYSVLPGVAYAAMAGAGLLMAFDPLAGAMLLAASQGGLLAVGIRNAWDLITWIAPRSEKKV